MKSVVFYFNCLASIVFLLGFSFANCSSREALNSYELYQKNLQREKTIRNHMAFFMVGSLVSAKKAIENASQIKKDCNFFNNARCLLPSLAQRQFNVRDFVAISKIICKTNTFRAGLYAGSAYWLFCQVGKTLDLLNQ